MTFQVNWIEILVECKDKVQKMIKPYLKERGKPQPDLGIGAGGDQIKQADLAAEKAIINTLKKNNVSFTVISEESGIITHGSKPHKNYVTIDPIDGTTNFMRGIPFYATSIAISTEPNLNSIHTALVADLSRNITYIAQKEKGAYINGKKISPSRKTSLEEAVIGIDLNTYRVSEIAPRITRLIQQTRHIRHLGANALELCYVADGTIDAFIDARGKLRTTDMAAAWLIIKEAEAEITTPNGKQLEARLDPKQRVAFIASANKEIHAKILTLLRS